MCFFQIIQSNQLNLPQVESIHLETSQRRVRKQKTSKAETWESYCLYQNSLFFCGCCFFLAFSFFNFVVLVVLL